MLAIPFAVALVGTREIDEPRLPRPEGGFDLVGALLAASAITLLLFGLMNLSTWGVFKAINAPVTIFGYSPAPAIIVLGLVLIERSLAFERRRERTGKPVIVPSAFLKPDVLSALALAGFYFGVNGALGFMIIIYLQVFQGMSAMGSGLVLAALALAMVLGSALIPRYFRKERHLKRFVTVALGFTKAMLVVMLIAMNRDIEQLWLAGVLPLGFLLGLFLGVAPTVVTSVVPPELGAQSSGVQGSARNIAQAIGTAVSGVTLSYAMTIIARAQTRHAADLSGHTRDVIEALPSVPVLSHNQLLDAAQAAGLAAEDVEKLEAISHAAQKDALTGVMIALILFTSLFWLALQNLPDRLQTSSLQPGDTAPKQGPAH